MEKFIILFVQLKETYFIEYKWQMLRNICSWGSEQIKQMIDYYTNKNSCRWQRDAEEQ